MTWFKVDDKLHDHRKSRAAGKSAMGVWVMAGSWSMDNGTDGFIPEGVLSRWGTRADAAKLITAGLWDADKHNGENGWRFHDWSRFQPSAAVTAAKAAAEREAGIRGNHKRWHLERGISDPDCDYCYRVPDGPPDQVPDDEPDGVAIGSPESGGESAPIRTVPVPVPNTSGGAKPPAEEVTTQTLIGEWIKHCGTKRPPGQVVGQVSKHVKQMVDEGIPVGDIRSGLAAWHRKGLHPATLASVVHETRVTAPPNPNDPSTLPPVEQSWMRR